ncbi:MAG: AbrB family transcriptional regulator, partial [Oscillospiraceae bacterium]|nr:AbrB family transcriptional regulator [Oscillospiraceae bacterium]
RKMNIDVRDSLEIYVRDGEIILKKYEPACIFCGNARGITQFEGKNICQNCVERISELQEEK